MIPREVLEERASAALIEMCNDARDMANKLEDDMSLNEVLAFAKGMMAYSAMLFTYAAELAPDAQDNAQEAR